MKQTTKMSRAVSQLEHIYNSVNADFFDGELPAVIITVQSSPKSYGHSSRGRVWKRKDDELFEINFSAEVLDLNIKETLDTCIHECCHIYCRIHNIQETSRGGAYHNKRFKEVAEDHGLTTANIYKEFDKIAPLENYVDMNDFKTKLCVAKARDDKATETALERELLETMYGLR